MHHHAGWQQHHAGWQQQHDAGWQHQSGGYPRPQQYLDVQQQQQQQQSPSWYSSPGAGAGWQQPQQVYFHDHHQQHQQPAGWQLQHPPTAPEHCGVPSHNPGYVPRQQAFAAQELHLIAQRCKEMIRNEISKLSPGGRLPSYSDHPKQFLQQNVFRTHRLVPSYTVCEWLHAQPTTFGATVTVPWLVDETCTCDHGRRAKASQQLAPTLVGASATAAQTLWIEILQRSEDPVAPGSASCFCRVAFGHGLASTRKEAERMAATDVARKLHAAGLVENLQLQGATEVAERNSAALSNELGWYASDPKSAAVNFAVSRCLNLTFDFEASESNDAQATLQVATATITLADGTRILTRGTGSSRKTAERAAALLLCEHPGVCVHLLQSHRPGRAQSKYAPVVDSTQPMGGDTNEDVQVEAPRDPGAKNTSVVVPAELPNVRLASPRSAATSTDVLSEIQQHGQSLATRASEVKQQQSTDRTPAGSSTEWYAHNPKLYLLRYSEQHSVELDWERGVTGPGNRQNFFTTLRVPLPGMLAEPLCETAWARTKREAEGTAATEACRKLCTMGLLDDPQKTKMRRGPNAKRSKSVAPSASSVGVRVRLSAAPGKMRTPHMKGLEECNHTHDLPDPVPIILATSLDDCLAELEHLDLPDMPAQPQESCTDVAVNEHYHCNPTLSPTVDPSQWQADPPEHKARDDGLHNQARLPICSVKDQLVQAIRTSQIVFVSGPSGSGKSTQLCQYVMDDWETQGHGNQCSIVHCCLESVVAESVASRVAAERATTLGTCVGFHTQSSQQIPPLGTAGARVIFTTISTLMHRLQYDPFLADVTHIIVDGVDAQSIQIDVLLTYTRTLLPRRNSLRLVLTAYGDDDKCRLRMKEYFRNLVCVEISATPAESVRSYFLEDVLKLTQPDADTANLLHSLDAESDVDLSLVTAVVAHIVASTVAGGILVFMPSPQTVITICRMLTDTAPYSDASRYCVLPLHAMGTVESLQRTYSPVCLGVRKIVVATSIAESMVPVDDIEYVVDTGRTQEREYVSQTSMTFLGVTFATRAACQRRRSTATGGRDGSYFCLLSADRASRLQLHQQPEMTRMPLTEAILLIQNLPLQLGNIRESLAFTPNPPTSQAVGDSVLQLHAIGALARETDEFTPLGRKLAQLSFLHPCIGKLLIIGTLLAVRDDVLTIGAALCVKPILRLPDEEERTQATAMHRKLSVDSFSDHYSVLCAYHNWIKAREESGEAGGTEYASAHFLSEVNLQALHCIRPMLAEGLAATGIVALPAATAARREELRSGSHRMGHLLRAAITSSLISSVLRATQRSDGHPGYCTNDNCRILLHSSSVNSARPSYDLPSPWLVFSSPVHHQSNLYVRETTVASIAAMLVLSQGETWERVDTPMGAEIVVADWVRFVCPVVGTFSRVRALRDHVGVALATILSRSEDGASCDYVSRVFEVALRFVAADFGQARASSGAPGGQNEMG